MPSVGLPQRWDLTTTSTQDTGPPRGRTAAGASCGSGGWPSWPGSGSCSGSGSALRLLSFAGLASPAPPLLTAPLLSSRLCGDICTDTIRKEYVHGRVHGHGYGGMRKQTLSLRSSPLVPPTAPLPRRLLLMLVPSQLWLTFHARHATNALLSLLFRGPRINPLLVPASKASEGAGAVHASTSCVRTLDDELSAAAPAVTDRSTQLPTEKRRPIVEPTLRSQCQNLSFPLRQLRGQVASELLRLIQPFLLPIIFIAQQCKPLSH